MLVTWSSPVAQ